MPGAYEAFLRKYGSYTEIQEKAISVISQGKNCLMIAPTGAGKTEAAALPVLDRISKDKGRTGIMLLYITPLRALNRDMVKRLESLCGEIGVTVSVRHGDTQQSERARQARNAPMVLITTPETLQSILPTKSIGPYLRNVRAVIVDEIHELYHNKRGAQLTLAMERLEELAPGFQRIGISATVSDPELVRSFLANQRECGIAVAETGKEISIGVELPKRHSGRSDRLKDKFGLDDEALARIESVANHIRGSKSTIIFANTRQVVEALGSRLLYLDSIDGFGGIGVHHSSLDRNERISIENRFKEGRVRSIIATSSLELGIDIGAIDLVVQYGSPRQALRLIQRAGRSGHTERGRARAVITATSAMDALEAVAIANNVDARVLESFEPCAGALDVLANQVCGIALDKGSCTIDGILEIARRSYVYRDLAKAQLAELLDFMNRQRMVGFDGHNVTAGGRTRMYYYGHLSVIPDSKRFLVRNMADNRIISSLDEGFVASSVDEGSIFITKGLPWKVISIDERVITVEPCSDLQAAVPDWSGEDIPVSNGVAQAVFALLREPSAIRRSGHAGEALASELQAFARSQGEAGVPSHDTVVVEQSYEYKVLHTGLGTMANDALSRLLSHEISARLGKSVNMKSSPYLVFLELPAANDIIPILRWLSERDPERALSEVIPETELFRYKFVTVAKLFGIIDRDATVSKSMAKRIIRVMRGTPVYDETLRELMHEHFDMPNLRRFLDGIRSGRLKVRVSAAASLSPLSKAVLNSAYYTRELMMPLLPSDEIIKSFARFMLSKSMKMICTYCGFVFSRRLAELKDMEAIGCPSCASPMVAPYDDKYVGVVAKRKAEKRLDRAERAALDEMMRQASLFHSYGGRAAIALSTYGIGPTSAARVLMMFRKQENLFYTDLIEAQKNFIKNRKYWSV